VDFFLLKERGDLDAIRINGRAETHTARKKKKRKMRSIWRKGEIELIVQYKKRKKSGVGRTKLEGRGLHGYMRSRSCSQKRKMECL